MISNKSLFIKEVCHFENTFVSSFSWSKKSNVISVSTWNGNVHIFEVIKLKNPLESDGILLTHKEIGTYLHEDPCLCTYMSSSDFVLSGGCDNVAKVYFLGQSKYSTLPFVFGNHDQPVNVVNEVVEKNLLVTGSWDCSVKLWDRRRIKRKLQTHVGKILLDAKVLSADIDHNCMVIACGGKNRSIYRYDIRKFGNPSDKKFVIPAFDSKAYSHLLHQTRVIKLFGSRHSCHGYILGSVEGRVHVQHFTKPRKTFTFKCHRQDLLNNKCNVYAINDIAINPVEKNIFATCGSDKKIHFWDRKKKKRLYNMPGELDNTVTKIGYNYCGDIFCCALSYDFSKGTSVNAFTNPKSKLYFIPILKGSES